MLNNRIVFSKNIFSKGASEIAPLTTVGPILIVYHLVNSEIPVQTVISEQIPETKTQEKKEEMVENTKKEEQKQEDPPKSKESTSITGSLLKTASDVLTFVKAIT